MASYSVKLVNHTRASDRLKESIKKHLQDFFDQAFAGTSDKAAVDWGAGAASDAIVLHFVEDVDHSYLSEKWPGNEIRVDAGGHTRTRGKITGSEFYYRGGGRPLHDVSYAKLAFHEALHNQLPGWSNDDLHGEKGGGGLAASPPQLPMTDKNKELMRRAIAVKHEQLL